nr:MarR family transcriptional regulator [Opitutus terrae]
MLLNNLPKYECLLAASKSFPELDPSATEVFLHLLRAGDDAFRVAGAHLAEHNLSQGRFMVLVLLHSKACHGTRPCTPAELAELAGVTRATMTGLIDTLERDGLVNREPDQADRRMMLVTLTGKARALLQAVMPPHFERMALLMQPLTESERQTLVLLLAKITGQAAKLGSPRAESPPVSVAP